MHPFLLPSLPNSSSTHRPIDGITRCTMPLIVAHAKDDKLINITQATEMYCSLLFFFILPAPSLASTRISIQTNSSLSSPETTTQHAQPPFSSMSSTSSPVSLVSKLIVLSSVNSAHTPHRSLLSHPTSRLSSPTAARHRSPHPTPLHTATHQTSSRSSLQHTSHALARSARRPPVRVRSLGSCPMTQTAATSLHSQRAPTSTRRPPSRPSRRLRPPAIHPPPLLPPGGPQAAQLARARKHTRAFHPHGLAPLLRPPDRLRCQGRPRSHA